MTLSKTRDVLADVRCGIMRIDSQDVRVKKRDAGDFGVVPRVHKKDVAYQMQYDWLFGFAISSSVSDPFKFFL